MDPGTIPQRPGMSGRDWERGAVIISQVEVPMILTRVLGWIPAPMAPMWASMAPTVTGVFWGRPVRWDHSGERVPAVSAMVWRWLGRVLRIRASSGWRDWRKSVSG